jgi:predicted negative regulator of RcsB-dependent stress response
MKRELVWLVTGALAVGAAVLGYLYWQETQRTGIDISVGGSGIRIEER